MKAIVTVNITKDLHVLTATSIAPADTEFNNTFVPPTPPTPVFQPENLIYQWKNMILQQINY